MSAHGPQNFRLRRARGESLALRWAMHYLPKNTLLPCTRFAKGLPLSYGCFTLNYFITRTNYLPRTELQSTTHRCCVQPCALLRGVAAMRPAASLGQHGHEDGGIAGQRRHRCPSFAPYITWVCGAATAVEYKWRSGSGVLDRSDPGQWIFCRVTFLSSRAHPRPSPPRQIYSPTHLPAFASRICAGFFSLPAGAVSASSFCRLVGHGCASCTCGRWVLRSRDRKGRWQSLSCA